MSGIYIHIPFCLKICGYCDFYRVTSLGESVSYVDALLEEMKLRRDYSEGEEVETIYFGGGTPSVLSLSELGRIMDGVYSIFNVSGNPEITIEVNPDDLNREYLRGVRGLKFNRLSIGIQSWSDNFLRLLNRRHDAAQAERAVYDSLDSGFENISVDLIYGLPGMNTSQWEETLAKTFSFNIKHLSAYHLSIEKGTPFFHMVKGGKIREIDEEESNNQFSTLINASKENGFIHYEISNLCREGYYSRHNTNYWKQVPYLGLGASAHSFNGYSRQWNASSVKKYISALKSGSLLFEMEELDNRKMFNEYIMTSLRTMWGIDLDYVEVTFEKEGLDYVINLAEKFISYGMMRKENNSLILTNQGVMIADNIISEFMRV